MRSVFSEGRACHVRVLEGPGCRVRISEGPACQVRRFRIDRSLWFRGHDKRAPPKHPSEGPACHVRISEGPACRVRLYNAGPFISLPRARRACPSETSLGGTCLSGPSFNVGSSIAFSRGLKSRAESGAKAPHSMECGDSSPLFGEGFSLHHLTVGRDDAGPPIHPMNGMKLRDRSGWNPTRQSTQWRPAYWRDLLVRSACLTLALRQRNSLGLC